MLSPSLMPMPCAQCRKVVASAKVRHWPLRVTTSPATAGRGLPAACAARRPGATCLTVARTRSYGPARQRPRERALIRRDRQWRGLRRQPGCVCGSGCALRQPYSYARPRQDPAPCYRVPSVSFRTATGRTATDRRVDERRRCKSAPPSRLGARYGPPGVATSTARHGPAHAESRSVCVRFRRRFIHFVN